MIWWILTLYPAIGLGVATYCVVMYRKYDPVDFAGEYAMIALWMFLLWPGYSWLVIPELWRSKKEFQAKAGRDLEKLLESVRRERLAPDPRLAEFDILLGIEPERKHWQKAHPEAAAEYDRNMRLARYRVGVLDRQLFSAGGHIPPTTELKPGVDIQSKVG